MFVLLVMISFVIRSGLGQTSAFSIFNDVCMRTMKYTLLLLGCLLAVTFSHAQRPMPKFKDVTPEDFDHAWEQEYPDAHVIILHDFAEVSFDIIARPKIRYVYHRRMLILDEAGLEYARVQIPLISHDNRKVEAPRVDGATYRLNPTGEVMKADIDRRRIEEVRVNEVDMRVEFEFPLVEVGAIVEYTYSYYSDNSDHINLWNFQREVPVIQSELHTYIPNDYDYLQLSYGNLSSVRMLQKGYQQELRNGYTTRNIQSAARTNSQFTSPLAQRNFVMGTHSIYLAANMPAYQREAHVPSMEAYVPGVQFRRTQSTTSTGRSGQSLAFLKRIFSFSREGNSNLLGLPKVPSRLPGYRHTNYPGTSRRQQTNEWEAVMRELLRHPDLGKQVDKYDELAERGQRLARKYEVPQEKAIAVYEHVRKRMKWDGAYRMFADKLDEAYQVKTASSAGINLILVNMLRGAGLNAYPVLVRTRDQGRIIHLLPGMDHFNHLIVAVQLPDKIALLDALSEVVAFGILPRNDLNEVGLLVDKDEWGWLQIEPRDIFSRTCTSFELDQAGVLDGYVEMIHTEFSAAIERGRWQEDSLSQDEYLHQYVFNFLENKNLETYTFEDLEDPERPFVVNCEYSTPAFVEKVNDYMFVNPMTTRSVTENPFPPVRRNYPVSFAAPTRDYYLFGMKIPPGYEVAQLPSPLYVRLAGEGGKFIYNTYQDGQYLFITSAIHLAQTYFSSQAYSELTQFFDYVVNKHSEDIVLRKIQQ